MSLISNEQMLNRIEQMTIIELNSFIEEIQNKFGVSAAMSVAAAPSAGAAAAPVAEEKSTYKVTLKDGGAEKIKTIKALRAVIPALSLSDAKKAVDEAPTVLAESASKDDAQKIKKELEAAGAKVELA
jgi:large subunit ribosomal protein L7/L12